MLKQPIQPHQVRVLLEWDELNTRLTKLNEFIAAGMPKASGAEQLVLLRQQDAMSSYLDSLSERIELWV